MTKWPSAVTPLRLLRRWPDVSSLSTFWYHLVVGSPVPRTFLALDVFPSEEADAVHRLGAADRPTRRELAVYHQLLDLSSRFVVDVITATRGALGVRRHRRTPRAVTASAPSATERLRRLVRRFLRRRLRPLSSISPPLLPLPLPHSPGHLRPPLSPPIPRPSPSSASIASAIRPFSFGQLVRTLVGAMWLLVCVLVVLSFWWELWRGCYSPIVAAIGAALFRTSGMVGCWGILIVLMAVTLLCLRAKATRSYPDTVRPFNEAGG